MSSDIEWRIFGRLGPQPLYGVGIELRIAADEGQVVAHTLGNEQTIKGVTMMKGQPVS